MKIGIVGAGNIGSALAATLVPLGHAVEISNSRGPETLADVIADTGESAVSSRDAVLGKDLVVVTIEQYRVPELVRDAIFAGVPASTIVVDTNNYYPRQRDGRIDAIEDTEGLTESAWVAQQLGHPVIKAFNNIYFKHLRANGVAPGTAGRIALPVAGDDAAQKQTVLELIGRRELADPLTPASSSQSAGRTVDSSASSATPARVSCSTSAREVSRTDVQLTCRT
jgi:8-hydroxy-5-deazaflavin:NADPH oxidoreductase